MRLRHARKASGRPGVTGQHRFAQSDRLGRNTSTHGAEEHNNDQSRTHPAAPSAFSCLQPRYGT